MEQQPTTAQPSNTQAVNPALLNRDYTVIIDRSGSMSHPVKPGSKISRYKAAEEATEALARKCNEFDPDGITVYPFSNHFERIDHTTPEKVEQIFHRLPPSGSTDLAGVLRDALLGTEGYITRKLKGKSQPNGEAIVVVTDGEPDDEEAVANVIVEATKRLTDPNELNITFLQVGDDQDATAFLKRLDDKLEAQGAKFDIVDTLTVDQMGDKDLTKVLVDAITEHKQHT